MNELQIFKNSEFGEVRTISKNGEPWFVGRDITDALGYANATDAISSHIDEEDKTIIQRSENATLEIPNRGLALINESGLYSLILKSQLPKAKSFKRWVTSEVLPTIRKTGKYQVGLPTSFAEALRLAADQAEQIEKQSQLIGELKPRADYTDKILKNPGLVTITQIAKDYGMSGYALNKLLYELGVQYKQSDQWLLYRKYHDKGYTQSETIEITRSDGRADVKLNTKWTQKGRLFLYNLLKENSYLPTIEKKTS